ncbi:MAG: endonuclease III [Anaerolineales bacterium]
MTSLKSRAEEVHQRLRLHYGRPSWRKGLRPLDELVSTVLSQNTNDGNRDRAFAALRERFPTWEAVCEADLDLIIDAIRPAGLANLKAPRIRAMLRQIKRERGKLDLEFLRRLPAQEVWHWLQRFKGVGPKTAAIVMLFGLGLPAFPVDTHIHRVTGRLGLRPPTASAEKAHQVLGDIFAPESYKEAHLNLIRHGREVCQARRPACERCVLQGVCEYYQGRLRAEVAAESNGEGQ